MGSNGIKDRVAIIGMGCTKFGEHWDKSVDDLLIDAAYDAYASAGIDPNDVEPSGSDEGPLGAALGRLNPVQAVHDVRTTGGGLGILARPATRSQWRLRRRDAIGAKAQDSASRVSSAPPRTTDAVSITSPAVSRGPGVLRSTPLSHQGQRGPRPSRGITQNGARTQGQFQAEVPIEQILKSPRVADRSDHGLLGVSDLSRRRLSCGPRR